MWARMLLGLQEDTTAQAADIESARRRPQMSDGTVRHRPQDWTFPSDRNTRWLNFTRVRYCQPELNSTSLH